MLLTQQYNALNMPIRAHLKTCISMGSVQQKIAHKEAGILCYLHMCLQTTSTMGLCSVLITCDVVINFQGTYIVLHIVQ